MKKGKKMTPKRIKKEIMAKLNSNEYVRVGSKEKFMAFMKKIEPEGEENSSWNMLAGLRIVEDKLIPENRGALIVEDEIIRTFKI